MAEAPKFVYPPVHGIGKSTQRVAPLSKDAEYPEWSRQIRAALGLVEVLRNGTGFTYKRLLETDIWDEVVLSFCETYPQWQEDWTLEAPSADMELEAGERVAIFATHEKIVSHETEVLKRVDEALYDNISIHVKHDVLMTLSDQFGPVCGDNATSGYRLWTALKTRFNPASFSRYLARLTEFQAMEQAETETPTEWHGRLTKKAAQVNSAGGDAHFLGPDMISAAYHRGIRLDLKHTDSIIFKMHLGEPLSVQVSELEDSCRSIGIPLVASSVNYAGHRDRPMKPLRRPDYAPPKGRRGRPNDRAKPKGRCFNCDRPGHFKRDCPDLPRPPVGGKHSTVNGSSTRHAATFHISVCEGEGGQSEATETHCDMPGLGETDGEEDLDDSEGEEGGGENPHTLYSASTHVSPLFLSAGADRVIHDGGCAKHIIRSEEFIVPGSKRTVPTIRFTLGDGSPGLTSNTAVKMRLPVPCPKTKQAWINVPGEAYFVPKACVNLVSGPQLDRHGTEERTLSGEKLILNKKKEAVLKFILSPENLYELENSSPPMEATCLVTKPKPSGAAPPATWHNRLGHRSVDHVATVKSLTQGLNICSGAATSTHSCPACQIAKGTRPPKRGPSSSEPPAGPGVAIGVDLDCYPMKAIGGFSYALVIVDHHSTKAKSFYLKNKTAPAILKALDEYFEREKNQHGRPISVIRCDEGGEFDNSAMEGWCKKRGILLEPTPPGAFAHFGTKVEPAIRAIQESANAMMVHAGRKKCWWAVAHEHATLIYNLGPSSNHGLLTRREAHGHPTPDVSPLRTLFCLGWRTVSQRPNKLAPKRERVMYIGNDEGLTSFKVRSTQTGRVTMSIDFHAEEETFARTPGTHKLTDDLDQLDREPLVPTAGGPHWTGIPDGALRPRGVTQLTEVPTRAVTRQLAAEVQGAASAKAPAAADGGHLGEDQVPGSPQPAAVVTPAPIIAHEDELSESDSSSDNETSSDDTSEAEGSEADDSHMAPESVQDGLAARTLISQLGIRRSGRTPGRAVLFSGVKGDMVRGPFGEPEPYNTFVDMALSSSNILAVIQDYDLPLTLDEAFRTPEKALWAGAAHDQYDALIQHDVLAPEIVLSDQKTIKTKLVLKRKTDENGNPTRHHVRLAAKGFMQRPGVNFFETFSPVASLETVKIHLGLSCKRGQRPQHFDVSSAFFLGLNIADENVFIEAPENYAGYLGSGPHNTDPEVQRKKAAMYKRYEALCAKLKPGEKLVFRALKGVPGLKQANRKWFLAVDGVMARLGFKRLKTDPCLYQKGTGEDQTLALVFVDDFICSGPETDWLLEELRRIWPVRSEPLNWFLGVKFDFADDNRSVVMTQEAYAKDIISRFYAHDCNPAAIPMATNLRLKAAETEHEIKHCPLDVFCGSVLYLARMTRPDILHAVTQLCRFVAKPTAAHWAASKQLLRYLSGTLGKGIRFDADSSLNSLYGFTDAEFASIDLEKRRSFAGQAIFFCGGPIQVRAGSEDRTAGSTAVAEYYSMARGGEYLLFARHLLEEVGYELGGPSTMYVDNQTAIAIGNRECKAKYTKHVEIKYHLIQDMIERGEIKLKYCPTALMVADILTKPLAKPAYLKLDKILRGDATALIEMAHEVGKEDLFVAN